MSTVSLDEQPQYRALSYVWGDSRDTETIILNGHRFVVTRNLKKILVYLRSRGVASPLWVDLVCINQSDTNERTHQVQLMRRIYEQPIEVLLCLGEAETPAKWRGASIENALKEEIVLAPDPSLFSSTGYDDDVTRNETVLAHVQLWNNIISRKDGPQDVITCHVDSAMLSFCLSRILAGDVHIRNTQLLADIELLEIYMDAVKPLVNLPWVSIAFPSRSKTPLFKPPVTRNANIYLVGPHLGCTRSCTSSSHDCDIRPIYCTTSHIHRCRKTLGSSQFFLLFECHTLQPRRTMANV